jgi:hypothetical protein
MLRKNTSKVLIGHQTLNKNFAYLNSLNTHNSLTSTPAIRNGSLTSITESTPNYLYSQSTPSVTYNASVSKTREFVHTVSPLRRSPSDNFKSALPKNKQVPSLGKQYRSTRSWLSAKSKHENYVSPSVSIAKPVRTVTPISTDYMNLPFISRSSQIRSAKQKNILRVTA